MPYPRVRSQTPGSFVDSLGSFVASRVRSRVRSQVAGPKTRIPCTISNAYGAHSGAFDDPMVHIAAHRRAACAAICAISRVHVPLCAS
jgi:hypothetical protein